MSEPAALLNVEQISRIIRVPRTRIDREIKNGRLVPTATDGRTTLFDENRLQEIAELTGSEAFRTSPSGFFLATASIEKTKTHGLVSLPSDH
jgi:hypothetical protein